MRNLTSSIEGVVSVALATGRSVRRHIRTCLALGVLRLLLARLAGLLLERVAEVGLHHRELIDLHGRVLELLVHERLRLRRLR